MGGIPALARQQITFGEMRAGVVRGLLIYCSDYRCSHWTAISGDRWPDSVRLSDIEPQFACRGAASEALMSGRDIGVARSRSSVQVHCLQVGLGTPCDGRSKPVNKKRAVRNASSATKTLPQK
jgi:hypothetical protein